MLSCAKQHYTNKGIKENGVVSINLVNENMLSKADYVGNVSGNKVDKSEVFSYLIGDHGAPIIEVAPVAMECEVVDTYDCEEFDNFILKIYGTYAESSILGSNGKIDYMKVKPVLFDMPNYEYIRTGKVIGSCLNLNK